MWSYDPEYSSPTKFALVHLSLHHEQQSLAFLGTFANCSLLQMSKQQYYITVGQHKLVLKTIFIFPCAFQCVDLEKMVHIYTILRERKNVFAYSSLFENCLVKKKKYIVHTHFSTCWWLIPTFDTKSVRKKKLQTAVSCEVIKYFFTYEKALPMVLYIMILKIKSASISR